MPISQRRQFLLFAQVIATKTVHWIPGRLRITVDGLKQNRALAEFLVKNIEQINGIQSVSANHLSGRALIFFDSRKLSLSELQRQIGITRDGFQKILQECSYPAAATTVSSDIPVHQKAQNAPIKVKVPDPNPKIQLVNTAITGGILAGLAFKRLLMGRSMLSSSQHVFNLAAITTIISGYPILRNGIANLVQNKRVNHDLLISAASLILLAMRESITGLSVLWLVQLSGLFNYIVQYRSRRAIRQMLLGKESKATIIIGKKNETIDIDRLEVGDIIVVRHGECIPVDGEIVDGKATINQAAICGEYMPAAKRNGDEVLAGMRVIEGSIKVKAVKVGNDTSVAQVVAMVEKATTHRGQLGRSGEIYSGKLVPWTIGISIAMFLLTRDYRRSLAILLAGCPAAVALSSNTAVGMAVAQAARKGIFVKESQSLETAEQIDTVIFDKTGTLTSANPEIGEVVSMSRDLDENDILAITASVEKNSKHPLARMIYQAARTKGLELPQSHGKLILGFGIKGTVNEQRVFVGNELLMQREGIDIEGAKARVLRLKHLGNNVIYVSMNQELVGLIGVRDILRPESQQAIEDLRASGILDIGVLTGDTTDSANTMSKQLGLNNSWGGMLPQDKLTLISELRQQGKKVAMIGDGINDSPAMAMADIGIAMGSGGADLAIRSADIVVCGDDPRKVAATVELGRQTMQIMRQNFAFSAGTSAIGIALAAMQIVSPFTAALLLNISTLGVVMNSVRLLFDSKCQKEASPRNMLGKDKLLDLQRFADRPTNQTYIAPDNIVYMPVNKGGHNETKSLNKGQEWHSLTLDSACEKLDTSVNFGLGEQTALSRLTYFGLNALAEGKKDSFWKLFRDQFKDFMVRILLGATGLSFLLGEVRDAMLTASIVIANALLGAYQESKAGQSIDALQKMAAPEAKVIRGGRIHSIKAEYLVPGDIIVLEAGDRIPADARLIKTNQFEVEEASLTGETIPSKKNSQLVVGDDTPIGDRNNMVFMGTSVTRGRAHALVIATGMSTEMGKIATMMQQNQVEPTPLQIRLEELSKTIVFGCLTVSGIVFLTGILKGQGVLNMIRTSASLAVAAIPEGLSAIVIVALALGVRRMAKRNILVHKMSSIETLGCASVICSDKTGTLTKNEMTVRKIYTADKMWRLSGEGYNPKGRFYQNDTFCDPASDASLMQTLLIGAICNNAKLINGKKARQEQVVSLEQARQKIWSIHGDPTEGALLVAAAKAGLWENNLEASNIRIHEIPFESERRMMSVLCKGHDGIVSLYCKGAADTVLAVCTHYMVDGKVVPLTPVVRKQFIEVSERMADEALRVLATAYRLLSEDEELEENIESGMILAGLVGMIDPPRPEVPAAIAKCKQAGVKVVMITGDHPNTAKAISRELGLLEQNGNVLVGHELDKLSDEQLADIVESVSVYARTAPQHKLRIIKAFKQKGYVVAMTGDGVNDAPAIKSADIGIAMGIMGTDVTKEAACMTLADDNFATIVKAMQEGRSIYANIRKAIRYALATNIGEVVLMFLAALIGLPLPLIPIQLLWINLIGDGLPVIALVNDPPSKEIMEQQPRSANDSVFSGGLGRKILSRGVILGTVSLALYAWKLMTTGNLLLARTLVIAQVAISQFMHIFDCRNEDQIGKIGLFSNKMLLGAVSLSMAMVVGIIHLPFLQSVFGTTGLSAFDWLIALFASIFTVILDIGIAPILAKIFPNSNKPITPCVPAPMAAI